MLKKILLGALLGTTMLTSAAFATVPNGATTTWQPPSWSESAEFTYNEERNWWQTTGYIVFANDAEFETLNNQWNTENPPEMEEMEAPAEIPVGATFTTDVRIDYIIPGNILTKTADGWTRTYGDYTSGILPARLTTLIEDAYREDDEYVAPMPTAPEMPAEMETEETIPMTLLEAKAYLIAQANLQDLGWDPLGEGIYAGYSDEQIISAAQNQFITNNPFTTREEAIEYITNHYATAWNIDPDMVDLSGVISSDDTEETVIGLATNLRRSTVTILNTNQRVEFLGYNDYVIVYNGDCSVHNTNATGLRCAIDNATRILKNGQTSSAEQFEEDQAKREEILQLAESTEIQAPVGSWSYAVESVPVQNQAVVQKSRNRADAVVEAVKTGTVTVEEIAPGAAADIEAIKAETVTHPVNGNQVNLVDSIDPTGANDALAAHIYNIRCSGNTEPGQCGNPAN